MSSQVIDSLSSLPKRQSLEQHLGALNKALRRRRIRQDGRRLKIIGQYEKPQVDPDASQQENTEDRHNESSSFS